MIETLKHIYESNEQWRTERPALHAMDFILDKYYLTQLLVQEVWETQAEHDCSQIDKEKMESEIADILVVLFSMYGRNRLRPDFAQVRERVNGTGKSSGIYDTLAEQSVNAIDGDIFSNVQAILINVLSLTQHLPWHMDLEDAMRKVKEKNNKNRPKIFFSSKDIDGSELTSQELQQRYFHSNVALRIIRNHYGDPLEPWMYEQHTHLILDFHHSKENIHALKQALQHHDEYLGTQVLTLLCQNTMTPQVVYPRKLERGLQAAGAVAIHAIK